LSYAIVNSEAKPLFSVSINKIAAMYCPML